MRILHITAHMGGGAGNAISTIIKENTGNEHILVTLQAAKKRIYIDKCIRLGMVVLEEADIVQIEEKMKQADIVLLHWWHHPVMCRLLSEFPQILCRIVLWSHISGCFYPVLQAAFAECFDHILFTTSYSYENKEWESKSRERIMEKSDIVYGLGDLKDFCRKEKAQCEDEFRVGYVGTLGQGKLNVHFAEYCHEVIKRIPRVKFLMVGDLEGAEWLIDRIKEKKLEEYFEFTGYYADVKAQLERMDVFAYPLNEQHFGTTENTILEAMLMELPPVLLNQNTEKYIVKHQESGMLVNNEQEYAEAIETLYKDENLRKRMGECARKTALERFSLKRNEEAFQRNMNAVAVMKKHRAEFKQIIGRYPFQWFLHGLQGEDRNQFQKSIQESGKKEEAERYIQNCKPILKEKSKSSILHFKETYPEDEILQYWAKIVQKE